MLNLLFYGALEIQVGFFSHSLQILVVFTYIFFTCEGGYGIVAAGQVNSQFMYVGFTPMK